MSDLPESQRLKGKKCIVTGGGSGIGEATTELFVRHGAQVMIADVNMENARDVVARINADYPHSVACVKCDVSSSSDVENAVAACVKTFGRIDVFFANAGILGPYVPIAEESDESFERAMKINSFGAFYAIKHASEAMKKNDEGGSIVCTASIAAIRSDITPLAYAMSKGSLLSLIVAANDRLLLDNVRINGIMPGGVMTPMAQNVAIDMDQKGYVFKGFDFEKYGHADPEHIAHVVMFLASDDSAAIKGSVIVADGGMSNSMGSQPHPSKKRSKL